MSGDTELLDRILSRLDEIAQSAGPSPRFFTLAGAASYSSLSEDSIRRLVERGELTALRPVRGRVLIDKRQLDALILRSTQRPRNGRGAHLHTDSHAPARET